MVFRCLSAFAADENQQIPVNVSGLLFGDFYYIPSQHLDAGDGAVGLVLRRGPPCFSLG